MFSMGARTHFLLRAAAVAVLLVEAAYPRGASAKHVAPAESSVAAETASAPIAAPVVASAPSEVAAN